MFLLIIKILGIIILAILIVAIVLMLFDINYNVRLVKDNIGIRAYFDCNYMLNAIKFKGVLNKKIIYNLRIFFIKITNKKSTVKNEKTVNKTVIKKPINDNDYIFYDKDEILKNQQHEKDLKSDYKKSEIANNKNNKKSNPFKRIINIINNRDIDAIKYLFSKLKEILKIISPKSMNGTITYGVLNPFNVGIALSIIGIFNVLSNTPIRVKKNININKVEFDIDFSGKIPLIIMLRVFIQLYLNKKTRILIFG